MSTNGKIIPGSLPPLSCPLDFKQRRQRKYTAATSPDAPTIAPMIIPARTPGFFTEDSFEGVLEFELVVEAVEAVEEVLLMPLVLFTVDKDGVAVFDKPVMPIIVWATPEPTENAPLSSVQLHFPDA